MGPFCVYRLEALPPESAGRVGVGGEGGEVAHFVEALQEICM